MSATRIDPPAFHYGDVADFRRRWADRVPRFPSDWPQMPAVEVDVTWAASERWFYGREGVARAVGS